MFSFCTSNVNEGDIGIDLSEIEFIGKWKNTTLDASKLGENIETLIFVNDSIAEIHLISPAGKKKVIGNWKYGHKTEIMKIIGLAIESDVMVSYNQDDNHLNILVFKLKEDNNEVKMVGNDLEFVKQ